ncbi:sulfotransferase [Sphingomonas sp. GlSt437]|uniref:tetratricopeptide repeat-containing sulfotransferase family protein n=1 Tax=Sphingomonas sp. GlSt437 TaxID=3389970 RepID=UPI003A8A7BEA
MNQPIAPSQTLEVEVTRLRQMADLGEHAAVVAALDPLIARYPDNRDLLLLRAHCLRFLGQIDAALATLDQLATTQPRYSLLHQERGLCYVARKDAPAAIGALLEAVNLNPALPLSWKMLAGVYRIVGDQANAATAQAHVETLAALPPPVVAATSLFQDGDLVQSEAMIRAWLLAQGDHPEAMRLLAKIGMARDVLDDAETLLEAVVRMVPDHRAARHDYAQCLAQRHKYVAARSEVEKLLALDPGNMDYRSIAATCAVGLGDSEGAIELYDAMLADMPDAADVHLWRGHALKTVGRVPEAIEAYREAARLRPDFGDAYWSLANLKLYSFDDAMIAVMEVAEEAPRTGTEDRIHIRFALGKAYEDRGEAARSWRYYAAGNALKRAESRYRPEILETNTRLQRQICTAGFFAARTGWGAPDRDPIFVLGLPRSGSTLIEQILASHSMVEGTQELADIQRIVLDLQGRDPDYDNPRYPGALSDLSAEQAHALGRRYLDDTRVYRTHRPRFIDKMPNNFRHIGLIHVILPNAIIIDARREPMACCFSNLKQLFAHGQEFTYSIEDIARYYRTYLDLMEHWDAALPGRVMRVHHEDVVDDLEGSVRRILSHCGLPFEQACVDFHQNRRSVRTPSSEQVRRPIFRDGLDQWTQFRDWLGPLEAALGDALTRYRR